MNAHVSIPLRGEQTDLFGAPALGPEGFRYQPELITAAEEAELAGHLATLPFEPFDFHGHLANRQVVGFGYRYDYASRTVRAAPPIPDFLHALRRKIAAFTGLDAEAFQQVLINEYNPRRRHRLAQGQAALRARRGRIAVVALPVPIPQEDGRQLGADVPAR